jgi:lipocalin-like protein
MGASPARLLGTWTLVAMEGRRASGPPFHPWGADVRGRLTYDADGHVALQIAKAGRPRFASDDLEAGSPEEVQRAFDGYHAWFGRFEVDADGGSVVHRIDASLFPNWEGQDQRRLLSLSGDGHELVLRSLPLPYGGEPVEFVTRWVRAEGRSRSTVAGG